MLRALTDNKLTDCGRRTADCTRYKTSQLMSRLTIYRFKKPVKMEKKNWRG